MGVRPITVTKLVLCGIGALALFLALPADARGQEGTAVVRQAAMEALAARSSGTASQTDVRVRRVSASIDSTDRLRLSFRASGRVPEGLTRVKVRTQQGNGRWADTGWALLEVARYDSVMTVQDRIRAGETVSPDQVAPAWMKVSDFHGEPMLASDFEARVAEGPLVATQLLQSGQSLREGEVRRPYTTDTGRKIEMRYTSGRFLLRLSCTAREPGFREEVIRVYCPDTETTYRARVTGRETARWIETL